MHENCHFVGCNMIDRLGYACIALGVAASTNRTCRLINATPDRLRALIALNLAGLGETLRYNATQDIRLFRLSSEIIPFASHPVNSLGWWEEFGDTLAALGVYARSEDMRLTMHPGQFTVLSSPRAEVVAAAVDNLRAQARLLDALGMDNSGKLTIHGGGTYGDKSSAIERFAEAYRRLPESVQRRLIVENDERSYSALDVLAIHHQIGIPVVFDALHDAVLPSPDFASRPILLDACFATWKAADGPPLSHFSSQDLQKQPGAHAEGIDPGDFIAFARDTGHWRVDCMLEAKGKDLALLRLRCDLASANYSSLARSPGGGAIFAHRAKPGGSHPPIVS